MTLQGESWATLQRVKVKGDWKDKIPGVLELVFQLLTAVERGGKQRDSKQLGLFEAEKAVTLWESREGCLTLASTFKNVATSKGLSVMAAKVAKNGKLEIILEVENTGFVGKSDMRV